MAPRRANPRISRTIYFTRRHDDAIRALAERGGTDFNKAARAMLQRGIDAPELPDFAVAKLAAQAASAHQSLQEYLSELVIRHALSIPLETGLQKS